MAFFPLTKPLEGLTLTTTACHLYRASLLRVLPFSVGFALIIHLIQNGKFYVPATWQTQYQSFAMFLGVLCLPILAAMIVIIDDVARGKSATYSEIMLIVLQRFTSLMAALLSMLLLPAIILAVGIIIEFVLLNAKLSAAIILSWRVFLGVMLFAAFTPKLFAPIVVFTDGLDGNSALDRSDLLVRGAYFKTLAHGLYGFLFIVLLFTFTSWITWLVPEVKTVPAPVLNIIDQVLIAVFFSWTLCLWMTQEADCQFRNKNVINPPPKPKPKAAPPPIKKPLPDDNEPPPAKEEKKNDNISF